MAGADLKFDEQIVCTKLAKEYLNSKTEFHSLGLPLPEEHRQEQFDIDQFHKKITYATCSYEMLPKYNTNFKVSDTSTKLLALAQKIEEHLQLFCQLEFLIRNIPIHDTKDVDLKLIIQSLVYKGSFLDADDLTTNYGFLFFDKDTPLFHLGLVAYNTPTSGLVIVCSKDTVAVCTLFVELCQDAGLEHVWLAVYPELKSRPDEVLNPYFDEQLTGCVGVVTARCDVDSAVDDLLAATTRYSWKLSGVLVQEAALERFTRALEWKTRGAAADAAPFVLEPAGDARGVPVEAFRSLREALSLIERRAPLAVAAWASDLAEANEIAFGARAPLVWLNGHGHFRGPPAAAAAVYSRRDDCYECLSRSDNEMCAMLKMQDQKYAPWRELAPVTRLVRIREVLEKFHARSPLRIGAVGLPARSTVVVDRGVCVVTRTPVKWAVITKDYIEQSFTRFLNYLLAGGAVHVVNPDGDVKLLCDLLSETGVPIDVLPTTDLVNKLHKSYPYKHIYLYNCPLYTIKASWTSIGTIFAN